MPKLKEQQSLPIVQVETQQADFTGTAFPSDKVSRAKTLYRHGIPVLLQKAFDAKTVPVKLVPADEEPATGYYLTVRLIKVDAPSKLVATAGKAADVAGKVVPGLSQVASLVGSPTAEAKVRVQVVEAKSHQAIVDETFESKGLPDAVSLGSAAETEDDGTLADHAGTGCLYQAIEQFAEKMAKSMK